mgnify:FL=1
MDETSSQNKTALRRPVQAVPVPGEEKKERIKLWMGAALIIFALCVDLAELFITWVGVVAIGGIISTLVSAIAGFLFWLWFLLLGAPALSNPKHFAVRAITFVGELIPFFDAIPLASFLWTAGTIITVIMIRSEDKGGMMGKVVSLAEGKIK